MKLGWNSIFIICMFLFTSRVTLSFSVRRSSLSAVRMSSSDSIKSVVICGPSGAGKGTLIARLLESHPDKFALSVSHTSRLPRPGEIDGFHYHFRTLQEVTEDVNHGPIPFIEHAMVHGNLYGTRQDAVDKITDAGKICVLDVDVHGVQQIKAKHFPARYIFIRPPTLEALEQRLRARNTETEAAIQTRLQNARQELEYGDSEHFDKVLVNGDLEVAWMDLFNTITAWFPGQFAKKQEV